MAKISVVINTRNEENNLPRALASVRKLADEIVVVDMESSDKTVEIAKEEGARVWNHPQLGYVEPARNFAIGKAVGDWILILDADEEIGPTLIKKLREIVSKKKSADFYRLPRKNLIFGKWIRHARWWPDYNIRFFKRGVVSWSEIIHSVPETHVEGMDLLAQEKFAIIHHNYTTVSQYLERMMRYTDIQAKFQVKDGYVFAWQDLIKRPASEFISRFFAGGGYKDGTHGLVLGILQAFSEAVVCVRVWEIQKFRDMPIKDEDLNKELNKIALEFDHWLIQTGMKTYTLTNRFLRKLLSTGN
ncbi:MAG: glycosyltransferase family 2 protein [Candidatus Blackburnbacteria bacterium]|nr:glycosyltransferase family 2 protein [Candidatus Blackburnbacteria bacterium]